MVKTTLYKAIATAALLAVGTTAVFAQGTGEQTTQTITRQVCTLGSGDYTDLVNQKLDYNQAIATAQYGTADILLDAYNTQVMDLCEMDPSLVLLQAQDQVDVCAMYVQTLVANYRYMLEQDRESIAVVLREEVENYLDSADCQILTDRTEEVTNELVELVDNTFVEILPAVIPYTDNACYAINDNQNFQEQIESVSDTNILETVYGVVENLLLDTDNLSDDGTQRRERANTVLSYARAIISDHIQGINFAQDNSDLNQMSIVIQSVKDILNSIILSEGMAVLQTAIHGDNVIDLMNAGEGIYNSRESFVGAIQAGEDVRYVYNPVDNTFVLDEAVTDNGVQLTVPAATGSEDTVTFNYRYYDGDTVPDPLDPEDPDIRVKHIIGDMTDSGANVLMAYDVQIEYASGDQTTRQPISVVGSIYAKPYIIDFDFAVTETGASGELQVVGTITFQGPQTCATSISLDYLLSAPDPEDEDERDLVSLYGTATINETDIVLNIPDAISMTDALNAYKTSTNNEDAQAAPGMNDYFDVSIRYNDIIVAELQAGENEYLLYFPRSDYIRTLDYYDEELTNEQARPFVAYLTALITNINDRDIINAAREAASGSGSTSPEANTGSAAGSGTEQQRDVTGCTDPEANNYSAEATIDDGSCTFNDPEAGTGSESGTGEEQPSPVLGCTDPEANNYNASATQDDGSCTFDPVEVPGCTDAAAENYDPAATQDDGSCTYPPILGCTDPEAPNYNPSATQDDGSCEEYFGGW